MVYRLSQSGETITMSTVTRVNNNDITGTSAVGGAILDLDFLFTQTVETDYYLFSFFFFLGVIYYNPLLLSSDQMSNSLSSEEQGCLVGICNVMPLLKTCANNSRLESVGDFDDCYAKKDAQ